MNDHTSARRSTVVLLTGVALALAACAKANDAATDTSAAASSSAGAAPATDTTMAGMKHDSIAGGTPGMAMNESAPKDSNQSFLRG